MNISGLANSVTAILGLSIHGGIPITVVKNNSVCSCQVHTHTPTPSWKDEAEYAFVCIESFHQGLEGKNKGEQYVSQCDILVWATGTWFVLQIYKWLVGELYAYISIFGFAAGSMPSGKGTRVSMETCL